MLHVLDWQDLCKGLQEIATHQIYRLRVSWFQKKIFKAFLIISLLELYVANGNQSSNPISLYPHLMMLYIKFYQNWPIDFRDIFL